MNSVWQVKEAETFSLLIPCCFIPRGRLPKINMIDHFHETKDIELTEKVATSNNRLATNNQLSIACVQLVGS